jgi:histone H2A
MVPPALVKRYLRRSSLKSAETASVQLAAMVEYFLAEVLELAGNASRDYKKHQITPRHVYLAVNNDEELSALFNNNHIRILGGGVLPYVDQTLIRSEKEAAKLGRKRAKARKERGETGKPGSKALPGTRSRQEMRRLQKTGDNILPALPFKKEIRASLAQYYEGKPRISGEVANDVQRVVEDDIVSLIRRAVRIMVHAKLKTLSVGDVALANSLSDRPIPEVAVANEKSFSGDTIRHLAQRAGSLTTKKDTIALLRRLIKGSIDRYARQTAIIMQHHDKKTFDPEMFSTGAQSLGVNVPIENVPPKKRTSNVARRAKASPRKTSEGKSSVAKKASPAKKAAKKAKRSPKKATKKGSATKKASATKKGSTPKK